MRLPNSGSRILLPAILVLSVALTVPASAATVMLAPAKDNTLFEDWPDRSNGAGEGVFVGKTNFTEALRRGVMAFDLSTIPSGSTINSVTLTLVVTKAWPISSLVGLHRATADWGEAGSVGSGEGAAAETGDATWSHRFWNTTLWTTGGGDYVPTPSATQTVIAEATYAWTGAGLVADVQGWVDDPASNFGWLIRGDEVTLQTAKRFGSRESLSPPQLAVDYTPPVPGLPAWGRAVLALGMIAAAVPFLRRRRGLTSA